MSPLSSGCASAITSQTRHGGLGGSPSINVSQVQAHVHAVMMLMLLLLLN